MCAAQSLVDIVKHGLVDENQKVKTITALTVSALAEAAAPYGIESFDDVLEPLWKGIRLLRGKARTCSRVAGARLIRYRLVSSYVGGCAQDEAASFAFLEHPVPCSAFGASLLQRPSSKSNLSCRQPFSVA